MWAIGEAYEAYIGRWSRPVAEVFVHRLNVPAGRRWLDVGCGPGALTAAVLAAADPAEIIGVDPSEGFLKTARAQVTDPRATFRTGDAASLPLPDAGVDAVVSGLVLNFAPDPGRALAEFTRVAAPGAVIAAYVWDYAGDMAMLRHFWDAATLLDSTAADLDEARRYPLCHPERLHDLFASAGLHHVAVDSIEIPTVFTDFDDYWNPFLGAQGPAPSYTMSLPPAHRQALRDLLQTHLPTRPDGSIPLRAKAWAARGTRPAQAGA